MSAFESIFIALLIVGLGGGFVAIFILGIVSGISKNNSKALGITTIILIILLIIAFFPVHSLVRYGSRNVNKSNGSYSSGYHSSDQDYSSDSDWDDYDYDNDGQINQGEWEDALGDYMDKYGY